MSAWEKVPPLEFFMMEQLHLDMTAGWVSGLAQKSLFYPMYQTRYQWIVMANKATADPISHWIKSTHDVGPLAMWSGLLASSLVFWPTQCFNIAFKDALRVLLPPSGTGLFQIRSFEEAAYKLGPQICSYPFHVLEVKAALDQKQPVDHWTIAALKSPLTLCGQARALGCRRLWRGIECKIAASLVERSVFYLAAELVWGMSVAWALPESFVHPVATVVSKLASYPLDLINVRTIAAEGETSVSEVACSTVEHDGLLGLWNGVCWAVGPQLLLQMLLQNDRLKRGFQVVTGSYMSAVLPLAVPPVLAAVRAPHIVIGAVTSVFKGSK